MGGGGSKPVPTETQTHTTTLTTRVPLPIAGYLPMTGTIQARASLNLHSPPSPTTNTPYRTPKPSSPSVTARPLPPAVSSLTLSPSPLRRAHSSSAGSITGTYAPCHSPFPNSRLTLPFRNILGELDCWLTSEYAQVSESTQTAACAWTVGSYASSELANLTESWITTKAESSVVVRPTITDAKNEKGFVGVQWTEDVYVTKWSDGAVRGSRMSGLIVACGVVGALMGLL